MANESTNPTTPTAPDWAERAMSALDNAAVAGCAADRFTQAERDLIDAAWLLLRLRFDRPVLHNSPETVRFLIERATADLDAKAAGR